MDKNPQSNFTGSFVRCAVRLRPFDEVIVVPALVLCVRLSQDARARFSRAPAELETVAPGRKACAHARTVAAPTESPTWARVPRPAVWRLAIPSYPLEPSSLNCRS